MADKKTIAICQSGGKFETVNDGTLSYKGGDAHAMDIDDQMKFIDFKAEIAEMFSFNVSNIAIKYFLPGNKTTLISISNDKDLQRMVKFHRDSSIVEIYIFVEEPLALEVSTMPASR
jgi:zinc finger SWIM domain-containing protein 3